MIQTLVLLFLQFVNLYCNTMELSLDLRLHISEKIFFFFFIGENYCYPTLKTYVGPVFPNITKCEARKT